MEIDSSCSGNIDIKSASMEGHAVHASNRKARTHPGGAGEQGGVGEHKGLHAVAGQELGQVGERLAVARHLHQGGARDASTGRWMSRC